MRISDLLTLPTPVRITVGLMLWPALWAGVLMVYAFTRDMIQQGKGRMYVIERDRGVKWEIRSK